MSKYPTAAFPQPMGSETTEGNQGMSMRQYYAAKALQGMAANPDHEFIDSSTREMAQAAFRLADAMIAAESEDPEIEAVKAERADWLECACDMQGIALKLDRLAEHMSGEAALLVDELMTRFRKTDANY